MSIFSAENITKNFEGLTVIKDVSVHLNQGEFVGLLGVSGVGKTTLFNVLSGIDSPGSGKVFYKGQDMTGQSGRIGYMMQKDLLLPYKSVIDNVALPLVLKGSSKKDAREKALPLLPTFGLAGFEDYYPAQLSGGMRQRAALMRTYLFSGEIMLLDEPFSALDALTKAQMHRWYLETIQSLGSSTLFISHDIDETITLSDRIYILSGIPGQITYEYKIDLPRPRPSFLSTDPRFAKYKREILLALGVDF